MNSTIKSLKCKADLFEGTYVRPFLSPRLEFLGKPRKYFLSDPFNLCTLRLVLRPREVHGDELLEARYFVVGQLALCRTRCGSRECRRASHVNTVLGTDVIRRMIWGGKSTS